MYASADTNFNQDVKIYRLVSTNGQNWVLNPTSPVLSKGLGGADWDRKSVETPAVVKFQNLYYMFYTGYPTTMSDATTYRIGYATSPDGITWTKKNSFIVAPTVTNGVYDYSNFAFNQFITAEPAPVVFNNQLYLYFSALGINASVSSTLQTIGLIKSSDGNSWSAPQQVLIPDQVLYPRASNWKGYSTPHAQVINGKVHMFVDVVTDTPFSQNKIHRAVSSNGESGWVSDSEAIFDKSEFTWTASQIRSPSVLVDGSQTFLWFAGDAGVNSLGIGLAKCNLAQ